MKRKLRNLWRKITGEKNKAETLQRQKVKEYFSEYVRDAKAGIVKTVIKEKHIVVEKYGKIIFLLPLDKRGSTH